MLDYLRRFSRKIPYYGAGILFAVRGPGGIELLLFRRAIKPDRGTWSVVGGRCKPKESYRVAAAREAAEEAFDGRTLSAALGAYLPAAFTMDTAPEVVPYNIPFILGWRNYLVELIDKPPEHAFRLNWENDALGWFPANRLPDDTHCGVRSAVLGFGLI